MPDGNGPPEEAPRWEYLIAHHFPPRYGRTFTVPWATHRYHICARCTGQALGVLAYVAVALVTLPHSPGLLAPQVQFLFAFGPLPGALDWVTQAVGRRESTNGLRLITGALAGATMADGVALIVFQQWILVAAASLILAGYVIGLLFAIRRFGAWSRVIEEHFPGLEIETP